MSRFSRYQVDPDVVRRAQAGDAKAHEIIYRTFSTPVFTLARRMIREPAAAEEVLQDTFVSVIQKIGSFHGDAPLWAWIRQIAVNKTLMLRRSSWYRNAQTLEDGMDEFVATSGANTLETNIDLEEALRALPDAARAVVWLHDVEGYTHKEIGRLMNKSESFSKSQLARGYRTLQAALDDPEEVRTCMRLSGSC